MHRLIAAAGLAGLLVLSGCGDNGDPAPTKGVVTNADVDKMMQGQQAAPAAAPAQTPGQSGGPAGVSPADPLAGQNSGGSTPVGSSLPPSGR